MRTAWSWALATAAALCLGCQTYDFEPVQPITIGQSTSSVAINPKGLKPNLMLILDRSGSMTLPFDASNPACGSCGQTGQPRCDPATCPSRWDTLSATTSSFLGSSGTTARMGVAFFPAISSLTITDPGSHNAANFCDPTSQIEVPLPGSDDDVALKASAQAVDNAIQQVGLAASPLAGGVGGGTPTGAGVAFVAAHANFPVSGGRESFLLLMTDGLPNCNPDSGLNSQVNSSACDCTDNALACSAYPVLDCNDYSETAQKIAELRASTGVKTIVVGYGDVFGPSAQKSLQAMAVGGGFQRRCAAGGAECDPADLSCFQSTNPTLCAEQFFRVTSQQQLAAALSAISAAIVHGNPCLVSLDPSPADPSLISVQVTDNGVAATYPYPSPVWTFHPPAGGDPATLTFNDPLCTKMTSASDAITYFVRAVTLL